MNQNKFNSQDYNGITNNQNANSQQPMYNQQTQIFPQSIPQNVNSFESGNINNQNLNNKSSKKINLGLIIGIVTMIVVVGIFFGSKLLLNGDNNNLTNGGSNNQNLSSESISQIEITSSYVIALTNSGKLYAIGDNINYLPTEESSLKETTLLAENVKSFSNNGKFYISNNDELYISGINYSKGGVYKQYKKVASNIKKVTGMELGYIALSNDGTLYAFGSEEYNGFGQEYDELTLINSISNVKDVSLTLTETFYLTNDNELYAKFKYSENDTFEKILDNVESCDRNTITTKDGKIYDIGVFDYSTGEFVVNLIEGANGVIFTPYSSYYIKDNVILDSFYSKYYDPQDVKTMFYMYSDDIVQDNKTIIKFIYLDNNNKLKLHYIEFKLRNYATKLDEKIETLNYDVKNLAAILDFSYD